MSTALRGHWVKYKKLNSDGDRTGDELTVQILEQFNELKNSYYGKYATNYTKYIAKDNKGKSHTFTPYQITEFV